MCGPQKSCQNCRYLFDILVKIKSLSQNDSEVKTSQKCRQFVFLFDFREKIEENAIFEKKLHQNHHIQDQI